ncbi:biotin/lipoyl-containing protein [Thermococcus sp.]
MKVRVIVDGVEYEVDVEELPGGKFRVSFEGREYEVKAEGLGVNLGALAGTSEVVQSAPAPAPSGSVPSQVSSPAPVERPSVSVGGGLVTAPMPGKVLRVLVREGESVKTGQGLLVLEAMKMENEIPSPKDGVVKKIHVKEGATVNTGDPLIEIG